MAAPHLLCGTASASARRPSLWEQQSAASKTSQCGSVNLTSSANGTGTYRAELWRGGQRVCSFMFGVYPHPGSLSWGAVESHPEEHRKFLRSLATGTPLQPHVIKFNADDLD